MKEIVKDKVRKQAWVRTWFQVAWFVLTNSYLRGFVKGKIYTGPTKVACLPGLNCYSCPGSLGSCPMGSLQAVMGDSTYRFSLYVFGFLAAIGAIFGRLVCGWMCPFGLVQDLLHKIPIKIKKKNLPGHKYLKYLKYVILAVFPILLVSMMTDLTGTGSPWFCEWICPSGMLFGGIPLVATNSGLRAAAGVRFAWKLFVLIAIVLLSVIYYRPFCKYLCPLGAVYSLTNPIASYRLVIDKDRCVACGACQKACGMDIRTFETPNSLECIRCGTCMKSCPMGAISSTWGQAAQKISSRCFVDEEEAETKPSPETGEAPTLRTSSPSLERKAVFFGIMAILIAAVSAYGTIVLGLVSQVDSRLTIDLYAQYNNSLYIVTWVLLSIALAMLLLTGVFAIWHRKEPEALTSVVEKARVALLCEVVAILVAILGIVLELQTVSSYLTPAIFSLSLILGIPVAAMMGSVLRSYARRETIGERVKRRKRVAWVILSILSILAALLVPLIFVLIVIKEG